MMRIFCLMALLAAAPLATADIQACNDMYPPDAYDPQDRAQYIQECLSAYGDNADNGGDSESQPEAEVDPSYNDYGGTVEDYVEALPEPETEQSEPVVEY